MCIPLLAEERWTRRHRSCEPVAQLLRVLQTGERTHLQRVIESGANRLNLVGAAVDYIHPHRHRAWSDHPQSFSRRKGEINDSTLGKGPTVVDDHLGRITAVEIRNHHSGAKW